MWAADNCALTVIPDVIQMGAAYNGTTLVIKGQVQAGSQVVLRFIGAAGELHMREKGKMFGLLWMNRDALTFKNAPKVYLVQSSQPLEELGPAASSFSLNSLRHIVKVEEAAAGATMDFDAPAELLRLKEREGLCRESIGGVQFGPETDGMQTFTAELRVPAALSPGQYTVEAVVLKNGAVVKTEAVQVTAMLVGLPAWLYRMAFNHGGMYGILATVVAILGGLLIGLVFQGKGGGAH